MSYRDIIFPLCLFLALTGGIFFLYWRSLVFFWLSALRAGLDRHLISILESLIRRYHIRPASKIFRDSLVLDNILKNELKRVQTDSAWRYAADSDYVLNLYKIKQVIDLRDHSPSNIPNTRFLPMDAEIIILQYKTRISTRIISQGKKSFSLLMRTNAENEKTYTPVFSIKEGEFLDLIFSVGVMEEYHFSAKIKSVELLAHGTQITLAHTKEISSLFYRRYREKKVDIHDIHMGRLFHPGSEDVLPGDLDEAFESSSIVSVSMAGCVLRMSRPCEEGLHVAIGFSVHDVPAVYYGRLGEAYKENEHGNPSYLVEVQFIQSTKIGLSNLGELVYEFRGT